jgi:hypothetical protein
MVSRKYVGDYRLENIPDRRGKLKTVPVYRGPLFRFKAEETLLKKAKLRCLILTAAASAALLAAMLIHAELLQRLYVVMPLILCFLPAALLWTAVYHLYTAGQAVPRDKCDKMHDRFAGWSVVMLVLCVLSLLGQIAAFLSGAGGEDAAVTACTFIMIVCSALVFRGKNDLLMEELPAEE